MENPSSEFGFKDDATPMCLPPYLVPRVHEAMFIKEVESLVTLCVLEEANESEWGAYYFYQPKPKTNCVGFPSDFQNLNRQFKRKPYLIPKIREILLNLEGFQYSTSHDLNMDYYHIRLRCQARNLCTIILPWGSTNIKV